MWAEIIFYNFLSLQSVKSFQYKRFIQTACFCSNVCRPLKKKNLGASRGSACIPVGREDSPQGPRHHQGAHQEPLRLPRQESPASCTGECLCKEKLISKFILYDSRFLPLLSDMFIHWNCYYVHWVEAEAVSHPNEVWVVWQDVWQLSWTLL